MTKMLGDILSTHGKAMLLTFELFWILVFVFDQVSGQSSSGIPQFIYVNF